MDNTIVHVQLDNFVVTIVQVYLVALAQLVKQVTTLQMVEPTGTVATVARVVESQVVQPMSVEIQSLRAEQESTALVEMQHANFVREVITKQAPFLRRAQLAAEERMKMVVF